MLDTFIIEEIKRREEARRNERPRLYLPVPEPMPARAPLRDEAEAPKKPESDRGVVIIDYSASS